MLWEPKQHPACKQCPLYEKGIVVPDLLPQTPEDYSGLTLLGEGPGAEEVKRHRPFIGPSGAVLWTTLMGHMRNPEQHVHATNCVRCGLRNGAKPSDGAMKKAIECCMVNIRENLLELGTKCVVAVGAIPLEALLDLKGIDKYRGTVTPPTDEIPYFQTSTLHPAGLLRVDSRRILWHLLHADLGKAAQLAEGKIGLWKPEIIDGLDLDGVLGILDKVEIGGLPLTVDVETTIDETDVYNLALQSKLATVGIGAFIRDNDVPTCVSLVWPAAYPNLYKSSTQKKKWNRVKKKLRALFSNPEQKVVFHNFPFDVPVLQNHFKIPFDADVHDTLLLHHAIMPKLPKKLQQVGSQFLPLEPWKDDFRAYEAELDKMESKMERELAQMLRRPGEATEDEIDNDDATRFIRARIADISQKQLDELRHYNACDVGVTAYLFEKLSVEAKEDGLYHVYDHDRQLLFETLHWTRRGIRVDMGLRTKLIKQYTKEVSEYKQSLLDGCMLQPHDAYSSKVQKANRKLNRLTNHLPVVRKACSLCGHVARTPAALRTHIKNEHPEQLDEYWDARTSAIKDTEQLIKNQRAKIKELEKEPTNETFNPGSPIQLREVLSLRGIRPKKLTKTGLISTAKGALWDYRDDPFVDTLFRWRERTKLLSTYLVNLPSRLGPDGALHPNWKLHATPSGRFGTQPAVQNWPKEMKKMMVARPGFKIVGADFSALELRISALLAGQEDLIAAFNDGADIHARHAAKYFPAEWAAVNPQWEAHPGDEDAKDAAFPARAMLRKKGKGVTFGKTYLAGPETLYEQIREERLDIRTQNQHAMLRREVAHMSRAYEQMYPRVVKSAHLFADRAQKHGFLQTAQLGRIRRWPAISKHNIVSPNEACNHPIQGLAADFMNDATIRFIQMLDDVDWYLTKAFVILQIHDALYAEVREEIAEPVARMLEQAMTREVTLTSHVTGKPHTMTFPAVARIANNIQDAA